MRLTKKLEAEIRLVYEAFWESLLNVKMKSFTSFLDDNFRQIGTTEAEVFFSRQEAAKFLKATEDQVVGNIELRNRKIKVEPLGELILIIDQSDAYVKIDAEWAFYARTRSTSLLQKKEDGWKFIQQHISFPDNRTQEGETIALEQIKSENLQLRDAVKRRTVELEHKNRELEIEAALERVRAAAMSMKQPADMIDVCRIISDQLQLLNVKEIRNVQTAIINDEKGTYLNYEFFTQYKTSSILEIETKLHPKVQTFVNEIKRSADAFFATTFEGKALKEWREYRSKTNQNADPILDKATSLHYYFYSIGPGALGVSSYAPLMEDELAVFRRFRNVFELSYRRFKDIELAIAQAKEARVETALERVRAVALSMMKPEELPNVCEILFAELRSLGFTEMRNTMINIHNDEKGSFLNYDYSDEIGKSITPLFYNIHPVIERQIKQIRSARDAFSETVFTGKELDEWKEFRRRSGEKDDPRINDITALHYYFYSIGTGSIGISTFNAISKEEQNLLKRFRNVFAFAYRRYMDVAQAEAQAYEARIEASLERVRAQAMSMMKSDELLKVCESVFMELRLLGFNETELRNTQIIINNDDKGIYSAYQYSDYIGGEIAEVPYDLHPVIRLLNDKLRQAKDAFADVEISGTALKDWKKFVNSFPQKHDAKLNAATELHYYFYSVGIGALGISSFKSLPEEKLKILQRLRNVFNLSYQRYTDIAQAEAQAREAQIELALERVRARTMAMQKSGELSETAQILFQQFKELGEDPIQITIGIINEEKGIIEFRVTDWSGSGAQVNRSFNVDIDEPTLIHKMYTAWKDQRKSLVIDLSGKELQGWINYRNAISGVSISSGDTKGRRVITSAFFSKGHLSFSTSEPRPSEAIQLLERFAGVFDLTYTRFLDLEKAEAQAREAQIEAALERVRSRSMGMQKSEELKEVIQVVYDQFVHLNVHIDHTGFVMDYKARDDYNIWIADKVASPAELTIPYFDCVYYNQFNEAKEKGLDFFATNLTFEQKNKFYQDLFKHVAGLPEEALEFLLSCPGLAASTVLLENVCLYIENFSGVPYSDEENATLMRFGKVFQQTYTRFLDLQKAEAQAREAKIEAALERTRTQSMIMQHSKELDDALRVFHEQVLLLGINSEFSYLWLPDEEKERHIFWAAWTENPTANNGTTVFKSKAINYPLDRNEPATAQCLVDWKSDKPIHSYNLSPSEVEDYFASWKELFVGVERLKPQNFPRGLYYVEAYMKYGCFGVMIESELSEDEKKILLRFAIEFERTYTRFLDLQKSEAQTREAQIEASLEKVRGKAMAMHTSGDISETMGVVFFEMPKLGISSLRCGVALLSKASRRVIFYAAANALENDSLTLIGTGEMSGHPEFENQYECWLKQENYFVTLSDEALRSYYEALAARLSAPYTPREHREQTERGYYFPFSAGNFYAWSEKPYSESEIDILQRFKAIIDLTFRRYLDLTKAEAQAREAQIETSLERVRSRTLAMQQSDELAETAAVLFKQLIILGIAPNRLYIAIIKGESGDAEFWITDEDGSKVSSGFAANLHNNHSFQKMIQGWHEGEKSITIDMQGKELEEYFQPLGSLNVPFKGGLSQTRRIQNIAYFSKGFIGMASPDEQPEETTALLERFAAVFNLTFTRFNDLKLAEAQAHQAHLDLIQLQAAKKRAEEALSELGATQAQLVQQEKLASLGQLTAGIAHEIKNPLNFVNNFSSVSVELVDEVIEEIKNSSPELVDGDVPQLLSDIKINLTKIIEHGARADGIVKSMLQHSRGGSGKKEPVDLNALVKEYVNLAFHGMRAGKNPINVDIALDLEQSIGKVPVIAEDFSRVIINLCQNAFDAMREKQMSEVRDQRSDSYLPRLAVRTRKQGEKVMIEVEDNGPGIRDAIKDKILQPFFTTKKGTQGTGLGLSITHDIVKAHGGEMNIETNDNGGATFMVSLPNEK